MIFRKDFPLLEQFRHLEKYLTVAGIKVSPKKALFILFLVAAVIDLSFLIYFILFSSISSLLYFRAVFRNRGAMCSGGPFQDSA